MASSGTKVFSSFKEVFGEGDSTEEDSRELDLTAEEERSEVTGLTVCPAVHTKRETQAENKRRTRGLELDVDIWSALDDHLQEKIIARLPFRSLFQASSLSKSWRLSFRSASFQSEVQRSAASWKSYSPLFVIDKKGEVIGYESSSQRWYRLPTHSYLPRAPSQDVSLDWHLWAGNGPLFCWIGTYLHSRNRCEPPNANTSFPSNARSYTILVANPLTKSWKQLPPQPDMIYPDFVHIVCEESKAYKVMLGSLKFGGFGYVSTCIQIFDSTDGSWTVVSYSLEGTAYRAKWGCSAVMNGVLYMLFYFWNGCRTDPSGLKFKLISLDVKEEIFKETPILDQVFDRHEEPYLSQLFVCGSHLMLVMRAIPQIPHMLVYKYPTWYADDDDVCLGTLSVFRFDLERCLAIEVSRAPKEMLRQRLTVAACNGDCIYIGSRYLSPESICYNVATQEWHRFSSGPDIVLPKSWNWFSSASTWDWHWRSITYQPGLDPFLKV